MQFLSMTRRTEIGANSYAITLGHRTIVVDAGMHPKERGLAAQPDYAALEGRPVDAILLSHAHQDHVGSLPVLTREHPEVPVFMTAPTQRIADIMLHNSVNVMTRQREDEGLDDYPLFTHRGVELSARQWVACNLERRLGLHGERSDDDQDVTFELLDAGHILGSAAVLIRHQGTTILYTGDVNFDDQTLMRGADLPKGGVDVLIMETTRGDTPRPEGWTRAGEEKRFAEAFHTAFDKGGCVMVPVFALGKSQEVLAMLWKFRQEGLLAHLPIYIGGLSTKISTVYDLFADKVARAHPELQLLHELAPYVLSGNEALSTVPRPRCIYALSSGMMTENTISNLFARRILPEKKHTVFFVGYSDPASPAGRMRQTQAGEEVLLDPKLSPVRRECTVESFSFSAHSDREGLLDYAVRLRPKTIVLVHGDASAVEWFRASLETQLPNTKVIVPPPGRWLDL